MHRIPAGNLFASASALGGGCKFLQVGRTELARKREAVLVVDIADMQVMIQAASFLQSACGELGFVACKAAAAEFGEALERLPRPTSQGLALTDTQLKGMAAASEYLLKTFRDELDSRPLFVASSKMADLLDQKTPPFGEAVEDAFPSSAIDVSEAAQCLALGRWTACVMHLMRALEAPLAVLAARCDVPDGANWNTLLNQIEGKIRARNKPAGDDDWEQWAAEAATHFRFIKNGWRNHAMHARQAYDEARATEIYNSVGAFLKHLATRLAE